MHLMHTHSIHVCISSIYMHLRAVTQAVFSALFYFAPIPLYNGVLVVGYATLFTTGPVFSLVLDEDVSETNALKFPELYRELQVLARIGSQ
tara:strand:- start:116 stop:388 length:273 start_codon:yes stop_codon:yes gene_type:complete